MWFINDVTIRELEPIESKVFKICSDNNIKVGNAWCKNKYLGRIISDKDYSKLMKVLEK